MKTFQFITVCTGDESSQIENGKNHFRAKFEFEFIMC